MSLLNKFMHPRNIYKTPPNFKQLAIDYPGFRAFAKQDISGKIMIDFKDQASLRALTSTLLKKDFELNVEIPLKHLVPTLPLRLNYLLWIEDLLESSGAAKSSDPILGFDVGTGAVAIYPLLAVKKNRWHMKATEVDPENLEYAKKNIEMNDMQEFIEVQQVSDGTIFKGVLKDEPIYDFSMCNPPFFSSERDLNAAKKSRSPNRPLPHNAQTGVLGEVVTTGGEVAFVKQMISESAELKTNVRIYTTMVGHKSNVNILKVELEKVGAVSWSQTEFCQGHTTRWGLAWTFVDNLKVTTNLPTVSRKKEQKKPVMKYIVPTTWNKPEYNVTAVCTQLENVLDELNIVYEDTSRNKHRATYVVVAMENTWCNQRKKRREMRQSVTNSPESNKTIVLNQEVLTGHKRINEADDSNQKDNKRLKLSSEEDDGMKAIQEQVGNVKGSLVEEEGKTNLRPSEDAESLSLVRENKDTRIITEKQGNTYSKAKSDENGSFPISDKGTASSAPQLPPLLKAEIVVRKICGEINIEMSCLDGTLGRQGLHQILQYIKNNFARPVKS